ncbi:VWA domain-containing protein [Paenibacillus physcomitrellae]|uniref:VWFA domain-containing protein n=1 Tax=Paenibacillus physcomitrellae TaxID=1619311 RepID=A0ABQ1GJ77_9BACL|nr:VWA domain-containing protein [Paenibacillus physcomitrellae]GGA44307.1 hypothetical protein GCM10010917_31990 [Paenibacillus physcomitrellae]
MALNISKSASSSPDTPCTFRVELSAEGSLTTLDLPLYLVFAIDATSTMGIQDVNNNTATRFQVAVEAIHGFLDIIFSEEYASVEKHIAVVSFGNGARVHVTQADAEGRFSGLVNPAPLTVPAGGGAPVQDHYIGANSYDPAQAVTALANFRSVADKTTFFYENEEEVETMINNISRYSNTNIESGFLLAGELLEDIPVEAHKLIILLTDGESAASSTFYAYYNEADIPNRINAALLVQEGNTLFADSGGIRAQVTNEDLIREGIDPSSFDRATFTPLQVVSLKMRALGRSEAFFTAATQSLTINPFAGEWHNFDGRNSDNATRVPAIPNLLDDITLNGYYWSNGRIGFAANYYYYQHSPFFAKVGGIWQYSQSDTGIPLQPVYEDAFFRQSLIGRELETVTFDNSETELMIFATDEKIPQTRLIDYYEQTSRNIFGSNEAKRFMIAASEAIRANGIRIDTIGIGHSVLLPEYLNETASSGQAFFVPLEVAHAQDALRDQMLAVTNAELGFFSDVVITDMVPRRSSDVSPLQNDGTFTLDTNSLQVAFVQTPESPVLFQPVDLNGGPVSVIEEGDRYIIALRAGDLWAPEEAVLQEGRFFRAIIAFDLTPNPGVISQSGENVPDIPANIEASVSWVEARVERTLPYPPALVFVPAFCTPQLPFIEPPVPPPPVVEIGMDPPDVFPGGEITIIITVQNVADIAIVKQLQVGLPAGFQFVPRSLVVRDQPYLAETLNNIDLGVNQPGEVDTILFRLTAPVINLFEQNTLLAILRTTVGDVKVSVEIPIEEEEE